MSEIAVGRPASPSMGLIGVWVEELSIDTQMMLADCADSLAIREEMRVVRHKGWLDGMSTEVPPARDYYVTRRLRRWQERSRRPITTARVGDTISMQLDCLQRHLQGRCAPALANLHDRAREALQILSATDDADRYTRGQLMLARQQLGRALSLGWNTTRVRSAVERMERMVERGDDV